MTSARERLVSSAPISDVVSAIEAFDLDAPWEDVAPSLLLTLPRRRPLPPGTDTLPSRTFPPGIRAGLGLDIGPALLFVSDEQLGGWQVSIEAAFDQAIDNVGRRVRERQPLALLHDRIAGVSTIAFQSQEGWASSLLLMPETLHAVFGRRDGLLLAPMRDLLLMMPLDTDYQLAATVLEEFAAADVNALDVPMFSFVGGSLSTIVGEGPPQGAGMMH